MERAPVLEASELAYVLGRLEQAVVETAENVRRSMTRLVVLFSAFAVISVLQHHDGIVLVLAPIIGFFLFAGHRSRARTTPEKMKPVVDAVREAPEKITLVRHYQTSDRRRVFVTDGLEIETAEHRLVVRAKQDWQRIYEALGKLCPNAKFVP